jgi:hypothetical protein
MNTYKLYQVAMVENVPICTFVAGVQATDIVAAETVLLENVPDDGFEYMIVIAK